MAKALRIRTTVLLTKTNETQREHYGNLPLGQRIGNASSFLDILLEALYSLPQLPQHMVANTKYSIV